MCRGRRRRRKERNGPDAFRDAELIARGVKKYVWADGHDEQGDWGREGRGRVQRGREFPVIAEQGIFVFLGYRQGNAGRAEGEVGREREQSERVGRREGWRGWRGGE